MNPNHILNTTLDYSDSGTSLNNVFNKTFPYSYEAKNKEIALLQAVIPNAFPNITSTLNNQYLYYYWYNTTGGNGSNSNYQAWKVDLSGGDGSPSIMTYSAINAAIRTAMYTNGHYLTDANGNNVYYIELTESIIKNKFIFSFTVVPTTLPTGWTNHTLAGNGSNPMALSASNSGTLEFMQIQFGQNSTITAYSTDAVGVVTSTNYLAGANGAGLQTNLGFTSLTANPIVFPTLAQIAIATNTTSPINYIADTVSYLTPLQMLTIQCNMISANRFDPENSLSSVLFCDCETIQWDPNFKLWLPINDGTYNNLKLTICDQAGNPLNDMLKHSSVFTVAIRDNQTQDDWEQIRGTAGGPLIQFTDQAKIAQGFKRLRT
jgi:hypothetical protein